MANLGPSTVDSVARGNISTLSSTITVQASSISTNASGISTINARQGYGDLTPIWVKDDGAGGWTFTTLADGRKMLTAADGGGAKTLVLGYHVPHEVVLDQVAAEMFFHIHTEFSSQAAGDVVIACDMFGAHPNGAWSGPHQLLYTITPSGLALGTNHIIELAIPTAMAEFVCDPDSNLFVHVVRHPGLPTDTFGGSVYFNTGDFHIKFDGRNTTSKDKSIGWVKA
jgi:hypothetical protein